MSGKSFNGAFNIKKAFIGDKALKKAFVGELNVYSSGYIVYYHIDTNNIIAWEVEDGADCIANAPQVSVPGYSLHGWRNDTVASSSIISSKTCDREGIVLYAVLKQTVTAFYNGNGSTGGTTASTSGTRYYNNGNAANPTVTLANNGYTRTNYIFSQWAMGSPSGTRYNVGASITLSANTTFYAYWVASGSVNRTFNYSGTVQAYTVLVAGIYKLEAYGAQGGNVNIPAWGVDLYGGDGGISTGNVRLSIGDVLYVCAGGAGNYSGNTEVSGGYNGGGTGGGSSWGLYAASGAGATHIATTNRGVLSNYNSYRSEVLLVAGGGGGALYQDQYTPPGEPERSTKRNGGPGNGTSRLSTTFGAGETGAAGGGGGYFGGLGGDVTVDSAGGSGYVGGCISGTTSMQTGGNSGNGYAKVTYISA